MYLWNIDKLNEVLIAGGLSEHESFKYLVANTIFYSFAMIEYSTPNSLDTWIGVLAGVISLLGIFFLYRCNGGRQGKDFVIRILSIGLVIFIRMLILLMIPSIIVVLTLQELYLGGIPEETTNIDLILLSTLEVIYIFWAAKHINRVARASHS